MSKLKLSIVLFVLFPTVAFGATHVQSTSSYTGANPQSKAFTNPVTSGNTVLIYVQRSQATADPSVADNCGNTYTLVVRKFIGLSSNNASTMGWVYMKANVTGGTCTITVSGGNGSDTGFHIMEVSGIDNSNPIVASTTGSIAGSSITASSTLNFSGETGFIYSGAGQETTVGANTAGLMFTKATEQSNNNSMSQYLIATTTYNYTVNATLRSGNQVIIGVALRDAPASPFGATNAKLQIKSALRVLSNLIIK